MAKLCDLRGGSKAKRVLCSDGKQYVLKLQGNPQGPQALAAEYLAAQLFSVLGIPIATPRIVRVCDEALEQDLEEKQAISGRHLAIAYAANPDTSTIYDIVPTPLLNSSGTKQCFWGALVADRWLANQDSRQAVFARRRSIEVSSVANLELFANPATMVPVMIDHGMCFNGRCMDFKTAAAHGLYPDHSVYNGLECLSQLAPWIEQAQSISIADLQQFLELIPSEWLEASGRQRWDNLVVELPRRATHLRQLMEQSLEAIRSIRKQHCCRDKRY